MNTQVAGNGVEPYTVGATAIPMGSAVKFTSNLLVVAASANRVFGFMLADGAISETQVPVAVCGVVKGKVKALVSANITALGAPLYVGATSGALTPTDPGSGVIAAISAELGNSGDLLDVFPVSS